MSLRVRLIVAFFLLSVVPLGALTFYGYTSNAEALRAAARREAQLLAGELSQRMQMVTGQLTERVERLVELANAQEEAAANATAAASATAATEAASAAANATANDNVADRLGQLAMLLNNVQLTDRGRGRGGRNGGGRGGRGGPPPPGAAPPGPLPGGTPPGAPIAAAAPAGQGATGTVPAVPPDRSADPRRDGAPAFPEGGGRRDRGGFDRSGPPPDGPGGRFGAPSGPPPNDPVADLANDGITINMMPIRQSILQQYASQEEWAKLTEAERQRIMGEVNQRMLGVALGIKMTTAEVQKRVAEAQRAAEEKAKEAAAAADAQRHPATERPAAKTAAPTAPAGRRTTTLSGNRLDVTMERNGEVVQQANAEINLTNLLGTVFSTTRRDSGEVPFAVAKDGHLYTPVPDEVAKITALGAAAKPDTPPGTTMLPDWIVVTVADPTGAGLKFGIARPVGDSLKELQRTTVRNASFGLGFIALALVGIVPLSGRLTRNLSTLSDAVHRIAQGDYHARVPVQSKDEIGRLALAFNQMAADVEQHQRAAVGQERLKRELELGRQIQHDMLPHVPLRLGLTEVKGVSVPAREVGGDFFNYFQVTEGKVALLVGDVSGKGVGAALLMANIQASLRTRLALGQDLASLASELDTELGSTTPGAVYATLFVAVLDLVAHELRYVNAGHNPQYVLRRDGALEGMHSTGLPVGLLAGHGFIERRVQVAPGDVLFFYTDGCVETENETGDMFGTDRLEAALTWTATSGTEDVLAHVEREVATFRGNTEAFDDATMMAVRVG